MLARKRLSYAALLSAPLLVLAACGGDDITAAATVNGTEIPVSDVEALAEVMAASPEYEDVDSSEAEGEIQAAALSQLIFATVLQDGAGELGIEISDDHVADTLADVAQQFGGEDEMYAQLEEQGLDRDEVDRQIALFAMEDAVMAELSPSVSDEDIAAAYADGVPARHILVEGEDEATAAIERIDSGEECADVAAETSTDGSAAQGGDLGFVQPGMTVPEFETALFGAEEGELVGPIESDFGFHIIERLTKPDLADVEDDLRESLEQANMQEAQTAYQDFIAERMEAADVDVDSAFGEWDPEIGQVVPE
jgi:parvulin-like peptidyl-prolyl isomerase